MTDVVRMDSAYESRRRLEPAKAIVLRGLTPPEERAHRRQNGGRDN